MTASVPAETDSQRLVVEPALAREVESAAGAAPHGRVLDRRAGRRRARAGLPRRRPPVDGPAHRRRGGGRHPADAGLGPDGFLPGQATRLVRLAAVGRHRRDAPRGAVRPAGRPTPAGATAPPAEFQVDAAEVNADTGGRDRKIGVSARRRHAVDAANSTENALDAD